MTSKPQTEQLTSKAVPSPTATNGGEQLTPRQRELAGLLAALLVADYQAFPPASVNSPGGRDRG
jgi:hypothetical protein